MIVDSAFWILGSGIPIRPRNATDAAESADLSRLVLPVFGILLASMLVIMVSNDSAMLGERDAEKILREAPPARVEFAHPSGQISTRVNSDSGELRQ